MLRLRPSTATLLLAIAAAATVFPAYVFARWIWVWHAHPEYRQAVAAFDAGFPLWLRGSAITWASVVSAAAAFVASGFASQGSQHRLQRAIGYVQLVAAATLMMWALWSMM